MEDKIICKGIKIDTESLAERILQDQYQHQKELATRYSEQDRQKCLRDIKYHLSYLCNSLTFESLPLFLDYIKWVKVLLNGFGLPTRDLVINLESMKRILARQLPETIKKDALYYLAQGINNLEGKTEESDSYIREGSDSHNWLPRYFSALISWRKEEAVSIVMEALDAGITIKQLYLDVFQPAQYELGRLWQIGEIDVAAEHYGTALTQFIMSQLYPRILSTEKTGRSFIGTCINGEQHEIGVRMVTDLLEYDGWDTSYLGANTPIRSIIGKVNDSRPDLVGISATMTFNMASVYELIKGIRKDNEKVKIIVGGYPFRADKSLWKSVGADGCAYDLAEATEVCNRLIGRPHVTRTENREVKMPAADISLEKDEDLYGKLFALNSELINTQRELNKKNIELNNLNKKLEQISIQDHLTSLYNRYYFYQIIDREINRANRIGYQLVLAMVDINNFKMVNDRFGHKQGDDLLVELAQILNQDLRRGLDTAFRWGGDEFLLLMADTSIDQAQKAISRVDKKLRDQNGQVSLAWGMSKIESSDIDRFIKIADENMYEHKKKVKK